MSLKVCVLGSGSSGNSTFVASESQAILVDLGLPVLRTEKCLKALGVNPDEISVVITHAHTDHIGFLEKFVSRHPRVSVYCHASSFPSVRAKVGARVPIISVDGDFFIGDVTVTPFPVSHDVPCVGYSFLNMGRKVTVATDTGVFPDKLLNKVCDSDLMVIESNHDETLLKENGSYPVYLKNRILSQKGHLSNETSAHCVCYLASKGVKQIVLAHLSKENNYPELAFETYKNCLASQGITEGRDVRIEVAYPDRMSSLFEVN